MTVNCHSPCPNEKAVFSLLAGSSSTCQYPLFRSMVGKHLAPFKASRVTGASVAQWSKRSPFTSEVAGSILSENFLNVTRTQCSTHVKKVCQRSAESRGFFRALRFPPTGKLTGWARINTIRKVYLHCCKNN